jgi:hypothetical protein
VSITKLKQAVWQTAAPCHPDSGHPHVHSCQAEQVAADARVRVRQALHVPVKAAAQRREACRQVATKKHTIHAGQQAAQRAVQRRRLRHAHQHVPRHPGQQAYGVLAAVVCRSAQREPVAGIAAGPRKRENLWHRQLCLRQNAQQRVLGFGKLLVRPAIRCIVDFEHVRLTGICRMWNRGPQGRRQQLRRQQAVAF